MFKIFQHRLDVIIENNFIPIENSIIEMQSYGLKNMQTIDLYSAKCIQKPFLFKIGFV